MPKLDLTTEQLYEVNDALMEVIDRMIFDGQTKQEIEYASLRVMWETKKLIRRVVGIAPDLDTSIEAMVLAAIKTPKPAALDVDLDESYIPRYRQHHIETISTTKGGNHE